MSTTQDGSPGVKRSAPPRTAAADTASNKRRIVLPSELSDGVADLGNAALESDWLAATRQRSGSGEAGAPTSATSTPTPTAAAAATQLTTVCSPVLTDPLSTMNRRPVQAIAASAQQLTPPNNSATNKNVPIFLNKLFAMVEDAASNHLIHWSPRGDSFIVTRHEDFAREVLPRFFKHSNSSSFVRQLNMYGFHKVPHIQQGVLVSDSQTAERWEYSNPNFRRDQPDLLCLVQRKKSRPIPDMHSIATSGTPDIDNDKARTSSESAKSRAINLHQVLQELTAVKKHQLAISEEMRKLQIENRQLWSEASIARERYDRQQGTIDNILRFLASIFTSEKRRRGIYPKNGGPRQLLLGNSAMHELNDDSEPEWDDMMPVQDQDASAILDELSRERHSRTAPPAPMLAEDNSPRCFADISSPKSDPAHQRVATLPAQPQRSAQPAALPVTTPIQPAPTSAAAAPNDVALVSTRPTAMPLPGNSALALPSLTDTQLRVLTNWLFGNVNTLGDLPGRPDQLADQTAQLMSAGALVPLAPAAIATMPGTVPLTANNLALLDTAAPLASTANATSAAALANSIALHGGPSALPAANALAVHNPLAAPLALDTPATAPVRPTFDRTTSGLSRTEELAIDLDRIDSNIMALVHQLGLHPLTGQPVVARPAQPLDAAAILPPLPSGLDIEVGNHNANPAIDALDLNQFLQNLESTAAATTATGTSGNTVAPTNAASQLLDLLVGTIGQQQQQQQHSDSADRTRSVAAASTTQ